jgi:hypothetical protein
VRDRDLIDHSVKFDSTRFWCAYTDLEEYHAGMWKNLGSESSKQKLIASSVVLLRTPSLFKKAIERVFAEWPISCKAEFTSPGNHLSWLGCASCCLQFGVPEELTRRAWWKLTDTERNRANKIASESIKRWINKNTIGQLVLFG